MKRYHRFVCVLIVMSMIMLSLIGCGKKTDATTDADTTSANALTDEADVDAINTQDAAEDAAANDENQTEELAKANVSSDAGKTPVAAHGKLSVEGTDLVDANGDLFHIHGISTHGINWFPDYVNEDAFRQLRDEWGVNCIRLAMYTEDYNGYCAGANKDSLKSLVKDGVQDATNLGMYAIIDWHILNDLDPNKHKSEAIAFFDEMSKTYKDYDNVLYEICNEPNGGTSWSSIKSYAEDVIPVIKANDPNAIIIVGTPNWSQDVDLAAKDPITGYSNIMYTIHFYADTHRDDIRTKVKTAHEASLPIFCTEFGICDAAGSGSNNKDEAAKWMSLFGDYNISYCIWNLSNKDETSALIKSSCSKTSGWSEEDLSDSGLWYKGILAERKDVVTKAYDAGESNDAFEDSNTNDDNQNDGKNDSKNDASQEKDKQESLATANAKDIKVSLAATGGWNDGKKDFVQYTVTLENTGTSSVNGWTVTVDLKTDCALDQSWNGNYTVSGQKITITPVDYNTEIAKGTSVEVGFIVSVSDTSKTPSVSVK